MARRHFSTFLTAAIATVICAAVPGIASAQEAEAEPEAEVVNPRERMSLKGSALDGDFLAVGVGIGLGPDYIGSDDYTVVPVPLLQGSIGGIDVNPRPAGVAFDLINDSDNRVSFQFGPEVKLNFNRAVAVDDELVAAFPELDIAVEVGPTVGFVVGEVLNPVDSLTVNLDVLFDVAGAHEGMSVRPTATYFTPLSRSTAVTLSVHTTWIDDDFADYYYSFDPALAPGTPLPAFQAEGGFQDTGITMLGFLDLNGDLLDGGFALFGVVNYTRVLGDASNSPFTSIAGSSDQFFGGVGIGYGF